VAAEVAAGTLALLPLHGLPPLHAVMGLVALTGRSHSPVAQFVMAQFQALARQAGTQKDQMHNRYDLQIMTPGEGRICHASRRGNGFAARPE